jgi:hypothetical protein
MLLGWIAPVFGVWPEEPDWLSGLDDVDNILFKLKFKFSPPKLVKFYCSSNSICIKNSSVGA